MSDSFSSFMSWYLLCIRLMLQSDAVHRLENYSKISLQQYQWCGTSELVEQLLGKRCEKREPGRLGGQKRFRMRKTEIVTLGKH